MYMKNLTNRMTLRLDDEMKAFVDRCADRYRISPSDYIRQCVAQAMYAEQRTEEMLKQIGPSISTAIAKEGLKDGRDRKTDSNDII